MKYKCTDCGQEYDVKPEFCDCGNNDFDEIYDEKAASDFKQSAPTDSPVSARVDRPSDRAKSVDVLSLSIFILCLILSVLSLIFIGRDTKTAENVVTEESKQVSTKTVPSIDKLWQEKSPSVVTTAPSPVPEPTAVKVAVKKVVPQTTTPKKAEPKKVVQTTSKPQQNNQVNTVTTQPTSTMTEQEKQEIIQKLSTRKTQTPKTEPKKVEQQNNTPPQVVEQPKQEPVKTEVKPVVKAPDTAQLKKELDEYKIALRNRLGKAINFGAVIGDGKCAVTFRIDQTGNLVERKFSVQSKNNSLNDAVYAAVKGNPTFKEPPAGYTGETLTLTVTMYGGNFEVKLK